MAEYILRRGSMQDRFFKRRTKLQVIGGGFGNGKTTGAVEKALRLAVLYPGSNGLMARSTYPKLNDTLRKEFIKWCPKDWIQSFPTSANSSNTCTLKNGSTINFRYIAQQGKSTEATTSNLLSATYDWAVIDQIEDPEIVEKDLDDILGRLRGNTPFQGDIFAIDDLLGPLDTMPLTGPRWLIVTLNPTRNWCYKRLIRPLHQYNASLANNPDKPYISNKLFCRRRDGEPILGSDGKPQLLISLDEGSTYENKAIYEQLGATDFIETLESAYVGQMRDRFLLGKWAAYEGLIYPQYNDEIHAVIEDEIKDYLEQLRTKNVQISWFEGYDFGIASPSCYGLFFVDHNGIVTMVDGYYEREMPIGQQAKKIKEIRRKWLIGYGESVNNSFADPDIFRRKQMSAKGGQTVDNLFNDEGIYWQRGDNSILSNISKIGAYLQPDPLLYNPYRQNKGGALFYHNAEIKFIADEFGAYYWRTDNAGNRIDEPVDKDDHAMDMLKYSLTWRPDPSTIKQQAAEVKSYMRWHEQEETVQ